MKFKKQCLLKKGYPWSVEKRIFDITVALTGLIVTSPLFLVMPIIIKLTSDGPAFFIQKRVGKNGKIFKIIKFRTMVKNAEDLKPQYSKLNHADGPVFKIKNDPRLTTFGKLLVKTGLDELPQLINVLKGEMSLVGPRPFPVNESACLTKQQKIREQILPGIVSEWVISGAHKLRFNKWMDLDASYLKKASIIYDIKIVFLTIVMITKLIIKKILS